RIRPELDVRVDPGGGGVDYRRAREHVTHVDPLPQHGSRRRKLDPRVDTDRLARVVRVEGLHCLAGGDEGAYRVGQVELALDVVGADLVERAPERVGGEDVGRGIELPDRALLLGRVAVLDNGRDSAVGSAHDPTVREWEVG